MTRLSRSLAKRTYDALHAAFLEDIPDILGQEGFVRSPFPSHHFGEDGPDRTYEFANLETPTTLEFLEFHLLKEDLFIRVYFNAVTLDAPVTDLGNDLRYLDIIRAEWLEKHTPCTVSLDALLA